MQMHIKLVDTPGLNWEMKQICIRHVGVGKLYCVKKWLITRAAHKLIDEKHGYSFFFL